jgi:phospholipid-transporting ATPase
MELVKVAQGALINNDLQMYHEETNTPALARTTSLNEELGQVDYIFSDKTGTLTRNQMEFLRCTIGQNTFGPGCMQECGRVLPRLPSSTIPDFSASAFRFEDNRLLDGLLNGHQDAALFDRYLTALCICHDVIAEYPGCEFEFADPAKLDKPHVHGRDQCTVAVNYQAASPDEKALVEAARDLQYYFQHRVAASNVKVGDRAIDDAQIMTCNLLGRMVEFELLASLEFTSSRKRASVVVRDTRDNKIRIFSKGADGIMFPLLSKVSQGPLWDYTSKELSNFSRIGLRTLVVACKEIPEAEFLAWYDQLQKARSDMHNRAGLIANAEAAIECNLSLIGTTAIEDRLQDGVPECIERLANAGIKIWVLTGDKVETAINIGRSCRLLTPDMVEAPPKRSLVVIDIDDRLSDEQARAETEKALNDAWNVVKNHSLGQDGQGLVISGRALGFVFPIRKLDVSGREIIPAPEVIAKEVALGNQLFQIASRCKAVICCRVSPKQKSQVVMLVKERVPGVTLAIGDGANDCPMIKAAHVGIGISGMEGLQAVMASDYAIAQFRFLQNLLLIHGARSYHRISLLILYSFYKNICVALSNIFFCFFSAFGGQMFFDPLFGSCFNLFFTALPVMGAAVFNAPVSRERTLEHPEMYKYGQRFEAFNLKVLFAYLAEGVYQSLVIFFFSFYMFGDTVTDRAGRDNDQWTASSAMFTYMVVVTNLKMALQCVTWNWVTHLFFWLSIAAFVLVALVYCGTSIGLSTTPDMYWVTLRLYQQGMFWWGLLLVSVAALLPYVTYKYAQRMLKPTHEDIVFENQMGYGESAAHSATVLPSPTASTTHIELHDR